ncbi:MAG: AMP-binding protein [Spirochaetia bacterium]|nr:AMP-binding protein [Spirochaetia bacterium]
MESFIPISKVLTEKCNSSSIIALRENKEITWQKFSQSVWRLVEKISLLNKDCWGLFCEDALSFAIGFFALLHSKKTIVMPPNMRSVAINEIKDKVDAVITDTKPVINLETVSPALITDNCEVKFEELLAEDLTINLMTSGSTGVPKNVEKKLACFEEEIKVLENRWGGLLSSSHIASTVSHQHIYGLLFRVLWPMAAGRVFISEIYHYPEAFEEDAKSFEKFALISSPATLKYWPKLIDLSKIKSKISAVFSSGGALSQETALEINQALSFSPMEILGSTETGGVAWRSYDGSEKSLSWRPFNNVEIKVSEPDENLLVKSPFTVKTEDLYFKMGDTAKLQDDGSFLLQERSDRIVKIAEKRISLIEMEKTLIKSDFATDCAIVVLPHKTQPNRKILGALIVLSKEGLEFKRKNNEKFLNEALKKELLKKFELVTIPKKWRYTESIPENSEGKRTYDLIKGCFMEKLQNEIRQPEMISRKINGDLLILNLRIPEELLYFKGHFSEVPILPGVVQIDWAISFGKEHFGSLGVFSRIENLKFQNIILPNQEIKLTIEWKKETGKLYFSYESEKGVHSSGRAVFEN